MDTPDSGGAAPTWTEFRLAMFGDPYLVWHDGADFGRLVGEAGRDPAPVARALRLGIAAADDVAGEAYATLADAGLAPEDAGAVLRAALPAATETFRVSVAWALFRLTGDQDFARAIVPVLRSHAFWSVRIAAAMALGRFAPTPELVEALSAGVTDPEYLVRYHSANALLGFAGRKPDCSRYPRIFKRIASPRQGTAGQADRTGWREVARELGAAAMP